MSVDAFRRFFEEADVDRSGQIDIAKLVDLFKRRGDTRNAARAEGLYHAIDLYKEKMVNLGKFLELLGVNEDEPKRLHKGWALRTVFRSFDIDRNGKISADDLDRTLREMGKVYSKADVEHIIAMANRDRDQELDFEEFFGRKVKMIGGGLYGAIA